MKRFFVLTALVSLGGCSASGPLNLGKDTDAQASSGGGCTTCRVFVSSDLHAGSLGGLSGADALCNAAAQRAGVGGAWTAWLSDSHTAAMDRIGGDGPWYLMDRATLAFANHSALASDARGGLNQDETGRKYSPAYVWTGNNPFHAPTNCGDWTSTTGNGSAVYAGAMYENIYDDSCATPHSLICFEH